MEPDSTGKRILILGGYGSTGRQLARMLIDHSNLTLTIAGRNFEKAAALADELGPRTAPLLLDAHNATALRNALSAHHLVLIASTTAALTGIVADAAIDTGCDYLDIIYPASRLEALRAREDRILDAGLCFITEAGFHPGLPAALMRWAAQSYDALDSCQIASLIRMRADPRSPAPSSASELVESLSGSVLSEFRDGKWQRVPAWRSPYRTFDFGFPHGRQSCVPLYFDEMRAAQQHIPELQNTRFLMAGFGPVVDWVVTPLVMLSEGIAPGVTRDFSARLLYQTIARFTPPPYGTVMLMECEGVRHGRPHRGTLRLFHESEYAFTAIPVAAFLKQWQDGSARNSGLHYMGMAADPYRLLADMALMGIHIESPDDTLRVEAEQLQSESAMCA